MMTFHAIVTKPFESDLPDPLPLVTKISEANPPTLDPSHRLLDIGKAGHEVQLLLSLGLSQKTILHLDITQD